MRIFERHRSGIIRGLVGVCMLAGLLPLLTGCDGKPRGKRTARSANEKVDPGELTGKWSLKYVQTSPQDAVEIDFVLVDITHKDNKYEAKIFGLDKFPAPPKLKLASIKDNGEVRLEVSVGDAVSWSFQGNLDGESVWGTLMAPHFQLAPAKMVRTQQKEIDFSKQPERVAALGEFMGARSASDKYVALDEFIKRKESNRSPLLIEAYGILAFYVKAEKLTLDNVKTLVANFRKATEIWGPRMAPKVDLDVGKALALQEIYPEYTRELLDRAEQGITDEYPLEWKAQLAESRLVLHEPEHALKLLKPLREQDEMNPMLNMVYAKAKEDIKDFDEAIKTYARLAVLPQFEHLMTHGSGGAPGLVLPSESVAKLWKEKHGDTKELDQYLKQTYTDLMKQYVPKHAAVERPANARVSLLELFTGAGCDPCVPADIGCEALRSAYSNQELVMIKYHTHIPMPDPLANDPNMRRFEMYHGQGTPMMIINGQVVANPGGMVNQAPQLIKNLQLAIDEEAKKAAPVELKLSATQQGNEVKIKGSVNGITTTDNDPRLIVILLENEISFHAPNGIRLHNCVTRAFPDGPSGIKLTPGKEIPYEATISLDKVKTELTGYIAKLEKDVGGPFPTKPLDLAKLQVAAFVQNNITKSYMQAAVVDVTPAQP